jgi:hypothetical protein
MLQVTIVQHWQAITTVSTAGELPRGRLEKVFCYDASELWCEMKAEVGLRRYKS